MNAEERALFSRPFEGDEAQESANRLRTTACFMGYLHGRWSENRPR